MEVRERETGGGRMDGFPGNLQRSPWDSFPGNPGKGAISSSLSFSFHHFLRVLLLVLVLFRLLMLMLRPENQRHLWASLSSPAIHQRFIGDLSLDS